MTALSAILGMTTAQAAPYPPAVSVQISVSTTTPYQGQTIEVSGALYAAGEDVRLTIGGIFVGTAHTNAAGAFDPPVVVPDTLLGPYPLTGTGVTSGRAASLTLTIRARPSSTTPTTTGSSSGLAFTGADVLTILGVALLLLVAGSMAVVAGRRRRAGVR